MLAEFHVRGYESLVHVGPDGDVAQGFGLIAGPIALPILPSDDYLFGVIAEHAAGCLTRLLT